MPSASTKVEKLSPSDGDQPIKVVLNLLEKKVRNLEKRKGKLDNYREDRSKGNTLNDDQKSAVAKYDEVLQILEFAKEIQKTVNQSLQESMKHSKKQARREQLERQQQEIARIKELLLLQDLLNNMGSDTVRSDFTTGENGAIVLSPEKLDSLDELYKLVSSSRDDIEDESISHDDQLTSAAEHLVSLLDGKSKEVVGTTYKEMKELLMSIHNSKYFDKQGEDESAVKDEEAPEAVPKSEEKLVSEESEESTPANQDLQAVAESDDVTAQPSQLRDNQPPQNQAIADPASGKFNFLQDSQIDLESPHMDPAVVVAHPMAPPPQPGISPNGAFTQNSAADRVFHPSDSNVIQAPKQSLLSASESRDDFTPTQPIPSQTFTNQNFIAALPQTFNNIQHLQNQPVLPPSQDNQNSGPPPPIPMPNQPKNQEQTFAAAAHLGFNSSDAQVFDPSSTDQGIADVGDNQISQTSDNDNSGFSTQQSRSGYGNRTGNRPPRGTGNRGAGGSFRGRGSYQNGRVGNLYQGSSRDNYYQSNNYNGPRENGTYRGRGAPRGAGGMRGNRGGNRGRGGYNRDQ